MIDVIRAGLLTTIQDLGRHGYRHLGVAMGGALDRLSLEVGNRLVGNRPDAAGLEITFGPTVLRFLRATRVAITGTEFGATLDGAMDRTSGVKVAQIAKDATPNRLVYDPGHPDADARGYVSMPNVQPVTEMVDLISASRAYEANVTVMQTAKQMFSKTLEILR